MNKAAVEASPELMGLIKSYLPNNTIINIMIE